VLLEMLVSELYDEGQADRAPTSGSRTHKRIAHPQADRAPRWSDRGHGAEGRILTVNRVTSDRAPTLDEAKVRFLGNWQKLAGTRIPSRGDR
jgi:hypothetical protein